MYPILYRKKTRTGFCASLLLLAIILRVVSWPGLLPALGQRAKALLGSPALFRAALRLETGLQAETPPRPLSSPTPLPTAEAGGSPSAPATEAPEPEAPRQTEPALPTDSAAAAPPAPEFRPEEAEAISFRGNCSYAVDKAALLLEPLRWPRRAGPQILIIHSHSCEAYTPSAGHEYTASAAFRTLECSHNVVAVGDALAEALGALGIEAVHDRTLNDYPDYNASYAVAREKIATYLEQYPSIVMVLDLHRDALEQPVRETVELEGQTLAPLMLVVGTDESGLSHPHWQRNLSCALKLQALANRDAPGLFKRLSFRKQRFNGDLSPGALIVEVGSTENTLPEAQAAMPYLARYLEALLRCP